MRNVLRKIKSSIYNSLFLKRDFLQGIEEFEKTGHTSDKAYQALIGLYCSSNGKFNEDYHNKIKETTPPQKVSENLESSLGDFSKSDFDKLNDDLNENGYIKFAKKLPQEICNNLYNYALKTGSKIPPAYDKNIIYDPLNPLAEIYRFDINDLMNNKDIQNLIMDPVLINIARNYFQSEPVCDFPAMWWSTAFSKNASSEAAQLYHFDMDRIKWLKIFIYLNDVDFNNGPHGYIRGSHKVGAKPKNILERGYVRVEDKELAQFYKKEDFVTVTGQQGEIFAGDTKCWHKGNPLKSGHRLVLEFQYSDYLFGANYPKLDIENYSEAFKHFCEANPVFSSKIFLK